MPEYIIPQSHKVLLQDILMELIKAREPDATFIEEIIEPDPELREKALGEK